MSAILFSLPVHESPQTVLTTIANTRRFNGLQHHIMLHVDANWADFDVSPFHLPNVHVNPVRWPTQHANSMVPVHLSNFKHACELGLDFQYFAVLHTSEMFVRKGLHDHVTHTDHAIWFTPDTQPHEMSWPPLANAYNMNMFKDLFASRDLSNYLGNLIEGSWWRRELFKEMHDWILSRYSIEETQWTWAAEECLFPTLAWHLSNGGVHKHPYCAFKQDEHYASDRGFVDDIRAGRPVTIWQPHNFVYDYKPFPSQGLFSVKRIDRSITDPMRVYISYLSV